jgi:hypothetical protein
VVYFLLLFKVFNFSTLEEKMRKIQYGVIALALLLCTVTSATAQISIGIGLPNVSIGINLPLFPELVRVPGYPVYYAPRLNANYFFYDGMYWVYQDDYWYASSWYNGPWSVVGPEVVPLFVLRIPVRYYRQPPVYFRGWHAHEPPRWGQHWGRDWERQRRGWNDWKRDSAPRPAPLPVYQRQYTGDRYPRVDQQHDLHNRQYRYQPREKAVRQHYQQRVEQRPSAPAHQGRQQEPVMRSPKQQEAPHSAPAHQGRQQEPVMRGPQQQETPHSAPAHPPVQQRGPAVHEQKQQPVPVQREQREMREPREQREHQAPRVKEQEQRQPDRGESKERGRGQGQGQRDDDRGQGRNR